MTISSCGTLDPGYSHVPIPACPKVSPLDTRSFKPYSGPPLARMTKTEKLLAQLVALPSVNPVFLPANHPHSGEHRVADFLATVAADAGLDVTFQKVLPRRSNLLARLSPSG